MSYSTKEEILQLGSMDSELEEFLKANPVQPFDYGSLDEYTAFAARRAVLTGKILKSLPGDVTMTQLHYTSFDGYQNRAKLYRPKSTPTGGSPLLVYYHGGGWCIGAPEAEEVTCRNMVHAFGAVCISIGYRLAPKFPFPIGPKDAWEGLKWAAATAKSWGADPTVGFVLGGTSAGGNLAAVVAHVARDNNLSPPLTGSVLQIPAVLPSNKVPEKYREHYLSHKQNVDVPILPKASVDMFERHYKPDYDDGEWYAAFNHPKGHKNLPPTWFLIDGLDPLRDEAILYEKVLREEAGVETRMDVYSGLPHSHWTFFPTLASSSKAREDQVKGMSWLLKKHPDWTNVWTTPPRDILDS